MTDPHINYFHQKIEEVIIPLNKKNQAEKGQISPHRFRLHQTLKLH